MRNKEESLVTTGDNHHIVGKDTTEYHDDGSSTTTHQEASFSMIDGVSAGRITGVTENNADGSSEHTESSKSGCFLTSACVDYAGLADDCRELTVLRFFRDNYVAKLANGLAILAEYYGTAPVLVKQIERSPDRNTTLAGIFTTVTKVAAMIEHGNYSEARACYEAMFVALKKRYL